MVATDAEVRTDPDGAALVVVDMQNGFCRPDGSLYAPGSEAAIEPVADLVDRAREAGAQVVYTRDVHPPEQFEDAHYYDEFDRWGDHVVEKHTYDAFHETELDGWLTARGIDDLVICGTLANVCVLHTAGSAGLRDYRPVIVGDAVGCIEDEHREYALDHAGFLFGEVVDSDDLAFVQS